MPWIVYAIKCPPPNNFWIKGSTLSLVHMNPPQWHMTMKWILVTDNLRILIEHSTNGCHRSKAVRGVGHCQRGVLCEKKERKKEQNQTWHLNLFGTSSPSPLEWVFPLLHWACSTWGWGWRRTVTSCWRCHRVGPLRSCSHLRWPPPANQREDEWACLPHQSVLGVRN